MASSPLLKISNLHASIGGKQVLRGLDLVVMPGEVHAVMGPNGSGKSTLAMVLAGREGYEVTAGEVLYRGRDLLAMPAEERAREGLFLSFQYPVEIPGVTNAYFLKAAVNAIRQHRGEQALDAVDFLKLARAQMKLVGMDPQLLNRAVNEGFSGGEKKRNEILQMALLRPKLGVLDETDSGLDIDALREVAAGVNAIRDASSGLVVITHYQRLLDYLLPDHTHVLSGGRIVKSGGRNLALELEKRGYQWIDDELRSGSRDEPHNAAGVSGSAFAPTSAPSPEQLSGEKMEQRARLSHGERNISSSSASSPSGVVSFAQAKMQGRAAV